MPSEPVDPASEEEYEPLTRADWDFQTVPDGELIACCLWEYARESTSLAFSAQRHRVTMRQVTGNKTWGGLPEDEADFNEHVEEMKARERRAGFDYERFLGRFWASDVGFEKFYGTLREYGGSNSKPWQRLPKRTRRRFCAELGQRSLLLPCGLSTVRELEMLWQANSKDLTEVRARDRPPHDDSEDFALFSPSIACSLPEEGARQRSRQTATAFSIDFSRFTDREIVAAFADWVRAHRPKCWRRPRNRFPSVRRGKKLNDYRVALERLAIMRLLHWHSPRLLRLELPLAWRLYGKKTEPLDGRFALRARFIVSDSRFFQRVRFPSHISVTSLGFGPFFARRKGAANP